jgi:DNA-directed RNA polymerase specialized sigma24 family protein
VKRQAHAAEIAALQATDDLTQEVALKAWRFLSAFRAESSFRTWLTRVAINAPLPHRRNPIRLAIALRWRSISAVKQSARPPRVSLTSRGR